MSNIPGSEKDDVEVAVLGANHLDSHVAAEGGHHLHIETEVHHPSKDHAGEHPHDAGPDAGSHPSGHPHHREADPQVGHGQDPHPH